MKISIKREQSQAGLSFAERLRVGELCSGMRKKFRPQVKNKLLLLLALLLTAATGAWATDVYLVGNGTGNWLNDVAWDPGVAGNKMTEQNGVYSITFNDVDANSELLFKFAINGSWNENYGCTSTDANELNKTLSNIEASGMNIAFGLTEKADVTISFNLSELTYMISTKGMKVGDDAATGFTVSLKDDVKDADKWTITPNEGLKEGDAVTLTYTGRLKVKGVKATSDAAAAVTWNTVDLSTLTADYTAQDGDKLTGTLSAEVKITIADGATVMLDGAVINGVNYSSCTWAGLTLAGDGTIILSGENSVKGFYEDYPGIFVPANKTLTIQGDGSLTASSNGYGAGIGGGLQISCGNITIEGGTVNAQGGSDAAGIGGGVNTSCGDITIANTVTKVTATAGENAIISIGAGSNGSCGTVTIGGTVTGNIKTSPYTYQP